MKNWILYAGNLEENATFMQDQLRRHAEFSVNPTFKIATRDRSGISWQSVETLLQQASRLRSRDSRDTHGLVI